MQQISHQAKSEQDTHHTSQGGGVKSFTAGAPNCSDSATSVGCFNWLECVISWQRLLCLSPLVLGGIIHPKWIMLCKWLADLPWIQEERDDNPLRLSPFSLSLPLFTLSCAPRGRIRGFSEGLLRMTSPTQAWAQCKCGYTCLLMKMNYNISIIKRKRRHKWIYWKRGWADTFTTGEANYQTNLSVSVLLSLTTE